MHNIYDDNRRRRRAVRLYAHAAVIRAFVYMFVSVLLALHVYTYYWGPKDISDSFSADMKLVMTHLATGLSQVHRKHERLQAEVERVSATLPALAAAAARAEQAIDPVLADNRAKANYDHQVSTHRQRQAATLPKQKA